MVTCCARGEGKKQNSGYTSFHIAREYEQVKLSPQGLVA
jgi:hypothetical protein